MPFEYGPNGLATETAEEALTTIQQDWIDAFGTSVATKLQSTFGLIQRLMAARRHEMQEALLQLYTDLDARSNEAAAQDRSGALLGVTRLPDTPAEVLGTATCSDTCTINDGSRVSVGGVVFEVIDGPYSRTGAGTIANVRVQAQDPGPVDVSLLGAWTIVDAVANFDSFDDDSQPIVGRFQETSVEYRARTEVERFRRAQGPLAAIEASVSAVEGVTYVRAYDNTTVDPVDANGVPLHAINVVVEGGTDAAVARAIRDAMPAGHLAHGTDVTITITVGPDQRAISFDRVTSVSLWVDVDFTTSTSEEPALADLAQSAKDALMDYTMGPVDAATGARNPLLGEWQIGVDVLPARLASVLAVLDGVDDLVVTTSLNGVDYAGGKRAMTTRQRAVLTDARITTSEV